MKKLSKETMLGVARSGSLLLAVFGLTFAQPSLAGGSPPQESSFDFVVPANAIAPGACAFDVRWLGSGKAGTITLPGNRFIFTSPGFTVEVTNMSDTTKTMTLLVTGAFHQSTRKDGAVVTVVTGRNLLGDPDAGMVLAIGTFSYVFDAGGTLIQPLTGKGQLVNVCELID